ncbi:MAG TPA: hypothetical protein VFS50_10345 [Meiothermus sp.]|nr:hypothetical protein [Meiothermus sp.]
MNHPAGFGRSSGLFGPPGSLRVAVQVEAGVGYLVVDTGSGLLGERGGATGQGRGRQVQDLRVLAAHAEQLKPRGGEERVGARGLQSLSGGFYLAHQEVKLGQPGVVERRRLEPEEPREQALVGLGVGEGGVPGLRRLEDRLDRG